MAICIALLPLFAIAFPSLQIGAEGIPLESKAKEVNHEGIVQWGRTTHSKRFDPSKVIQHSWQPRVFLYKSFLSDVECDYLISLAKQKMKTSEKHGETLEPEITNVFLNTEDDISSRIEERVLSWTFLPKENSEPFNVMHLGVEDANQKYDYFSKKSTGEPLVATVIIYLSNVSHGGQIIFPDSHMENSGSKQNTWSDCSKIITSLRPVKGNAILFFNVRPNSSPDSSSLHRRCPVLEGEMWYGTKLFHVKPYTLEEGVTVQSKGKDGNCSDEDDNCPRWAGIGECQKNPVFMVGSPDYYGTCRKSCNACSSA